jgi:Fe-S oxidoreductase
MKAEEALLKKMGLDFEILDSGCCGMAGSFGFEKDKYEISQRIAELVLLPAVRNAPAGTLIISDGFSCREQIAMGTRKQALHLAEVMQLALREGKQTIPLREAA